MPRVLQALPVAAVMVSLVIGWRRARRMSAHARQTQIRT
jgi:hypothetical protein